QRIKTIEQQIEDYKQGFPEMEKQRQTYEELFAKYKVQLTEKQQQLIDSESKIQDLTESMASFDEQISKKEELIEANEKRLDDLKKNIDATNTEYIEREERLNSLTEKLDFMQAEHDKLSKAKEVIEKSTNESKALLQKLKIELENQEEEIRDKESRIHRLETLSFIYRLSKFFGGILIGVGLFFIILVIGDIFNFINFGDVQIINLGDLSFGVVSLLLFISALFSIISGIFHLEKS
ncbi:MAG: hypothetical protein ACFFGP_09415, partial [Promethearchaeota archaeon]